MRAYAVLAGGGMKGAALAGCLLAAQEKGIKFLGYGGSSAGAIVAFLSALGYSPDELHEILTVTDFAAFFPGVSDLPKCAADIAASRSIKDLGLVYWKHRKLFRRIAEKFGLDDGALFKDFLLNKARAKLGAEARFQTDVTFEDFKQRKLPLLKVVVTDLQDRAPAVYSGAGDHERNGSAIDAVRASMSYPLVIEPPSGTMGRRLVDGGLSTNLPAFLFEAERARTSLPLFAFDLAARPTAPPNPYGVRNFLSDLATTALDSADQLQRRLLTNVYHIQIPVPSTVGTFDFGLTTADRENLFTIGHSQASSYFSRMKHWSQAAGVVEQLQALHVPNELMKNVLNALVRDVEAASKAKDIRAHVMLPTGIGTRIVVYQCGMDGHPDQDLELDNDGGCSGKAWSSRDLALADLNDAKATYAVNWKMTAAQQARVRQEQMSMCSVPLFDTTDRLAQSIDELDVFGTLSVDSMTPFDQTGWQDAGLLNPRLAQTMTNWADIISEILR